VKKEYTAIGVMSGTSLDGMDIACCQFTHTKKGWSYRVDCAETVPYTSAWKKRLASVENLTAQDLAITDAEYGHLTGRLVADFIKRKRVRPAFIASHGHTIFHQPQRHMTFQIGNGAAIASETGVTVACDFRTSDVAMGGQGAPLVPIGDRQLFGQHACCLNLGGFANISYEIRNKRVAFDICPVNIVLNRLAAKAGLDFDMGGALAAQGRLHSGLLSELDRLAYYSLKPPKSLGKEWVIAEFLPLLEKSRIPLKDKLHTVCHHMARTIASASAGAGEGTMLVTGGGAYNHFLVDAIRVKSKQTLVIPDDLTVSFKEAIIFAFLGVLRITGQPNALRSVTGAKKDTIGGAVYAATT
jgi:anhydro-N-acetylmuramic acid kinase